MRQQQNHHKHHQELKGQCRFLDQRVTGGSTPKPRFKHASFLSGNTFYLYAGTGVPCTDTLESPLELHWVELGRNSLRWERGRLKCSSKDLEPVSGLGVAGKDRQWYFFGGSNGQFKCNNHLWRLNLDLLEIEHLEGGGQAPSPRESVSMVLLGEWLLLYGGVDTSLPDIYNSFHLYSLSAKAWSRVGGTYLSQIYPRHDSALCLSGQSLFLFGGTYRSATENHEMYLNDFYRLQLALPTTDTPPVLSVTRIQSLTMPEARSGHNLVPLGEQHLLLVGGENSKMQVRDGIRTEGISLTDAAWVYSIPLNSWRKVLLPGFKPRTQASSCYGGEKIYLYGGIHSYTQLLSDFVQLTVSPQELSKADPHSLPCSICTSPVPSPSSIAAISSTLLEDLAGNIQFIFGAVGLLVDNAVGQGATVVNLIYESGGRKPILRVEDNARLPWSEDEFFGAMGNFKLEAVPIPSGIEKKMKVAMARENQRRQFGTYAKLASLRLGSGFLHISHSDDDKIVRVCLFSKDHDRNCYVMKYYSFFRESGEVLDPKMGAVKREIEEQHSALILEATLRHYVRNTLFLLETRIQNWGQVAEDSEEELKAHFKTNDIVCGTVASHSEMEESGYNVGQCVDVSLRAYLVCLYLKNEVTKISLGVGGEATPIGTQVYLDRLDKLTKHKHVLDITNLIEFQFKIVELYYLYDLTKKVNYFSNGLLIYHKNRLITRHQYPLGSLSAHLHHHKNYNFIRLFGFVELPDHVSVNSLKTNVTYPLILNKLSSRLTFIDHMLKQQLRKFHAEGPLKRPGPTKQSIEEFCQDQLQNPELALPSHNSSRLKKRSRHQRTPLEHPQCKGQQHSKAQADEADIEEMSGEEEEVQSEKDELKGKEGGEVLEEEEECEIKVFLPIVQVSQNNKATAVNQAQSSENHDGSSKNSSLNPVRPQKEGEDLNAANGRVSFPIKISKVRSPQSAMEQQNIAEPGGRVEEKRSSSGRGGEMMENRAEKQVVKQSEKQVLKQSKQVVKQSRQVLKQSEKQVLKQSGLQMKQ